MTAKGSASQITGAVDATRGWIVDSLFNLISGLGTAADKSTHVRYTFSHLSKDQLDAAYRGSWIARKIVDIPSFDATREWRDWQAEKPQIEAIEAVEKRFSVQRKVMQARTRARLYGGAGLVIGIGDLDPTQELNAETIKRDGLKYLHVVNRHEITAGELTADIRSPYYGQPSYYEVQPTNQAPVRLHPSRLVRFIGNDLPDINLSTDGWGDSILQVVDEAIKQAGMCAGGIAALIDEVKIDVVKVPGLTKNIATKEYQSRLTERFAFANQAKSIVRTLVLDKEEEWNRIQTNFSQLPELMRVFLLIASAAADIPATRMVGQSPLGLNATGESDLRNYYDRISHEQRNDIGPTLATLDEVLIRTALGDRPPELHYLWAPLWQMDEIQKADVGHKKAQTFQIDVNSGLIDSEALRKGRENQLVEDGTYPGLDAALEEAEAAADQIDENDPEVLAQFDRGKKRVKDAMPRTLYVRRQVKNAAKIIAWAKKQGIENLVPAGELHVTVIYSREPVDWIKMGQAYAGKDGEIKIAPGGPRVVEPLGPKGSLVLQFASSELCWRHESMKYAGASSEYDEFVPHITLTNEPGAVALSEIEPYRGAIELGPEVFEKIDDSKLDKLRSAA